MVPVSRWGSSRWEISYLPSYCAICRLDVLVNAYGEPDEAVRAASGRISCGAVDAECPWLRGRGLSDTANAGEPAYPLSYNGAGEEVAAAPPSNPSRVALPWRSRMGAPPPFPRVGAA